MFERGEKSLTLLFLLELHPTAFLNSHLFPSFPIQMTTLETFCTGVVSQAGLEQVSIRLRHGSVPPAVPQATSEYTTNFLSIFLMCLSHASQLKYWLVLMTLYFHFHNTIPLSLHLGNCTRLGSVC